MAPALALDCGLQALPHAHGHQKVLCTAVDQLLTCLYVERTSMHIL